MAALWLVAVVVAGYASTRERGIALVLVVIVLLVAIMAARTSWLVAVCAAPALYIPAAAMPTPVLGVRAVQIVGLATALLVVVCLIVRRRKVVGLWACAPAVLLVAFGFAGGSFGTDLRAQGGLALAWVAASLLGALAVSDRRYLSALLYSGLPAALFAILECVGLPNYWNRVTGATLYAAWPTFAGLHRAMAFFGHPLIASAIFASLALLAVTARPKRGGAWLAGLYALACVGTLSRTGLVALGAGALTLAFFPPTGVSRTRIAGLLGVALAIVIGVAASSVASSFGSRVNQQDNAGRVASLTILAHSITADPGSVLFGGGVNGARAYLTSLGGNTATTLVDPDIFDNQLVTSVYDYGLVPLAFIAALIVIGAIAAGPGIRAVALPPFVAIAVSMLFADELYWPSASFVLFFFIGMLARFGSVGLGAAYDDPHGSPYREILSGGAQ